MLDNFCFVLLHFLQNFDLSQWMLLAATLRDVFVVSFLHFSRGQLGCSA